jgi:type II secretory pathway predicted ATPase ExeA
MSLQTEVYTLPAWVVTALVNDDFSDLSDHEERQVELFINHELRRHKRFHVLMPNGEPEFMSHNDFDSLAGDCYRVEVMI